MWFTSKYINKNCIFFLLRPFLFVISIFQFYFLLKKYKFNLLLAQCGGYGDFRSEISGLLAKNFKFSN